MKKVQSLFPELAKIVQEEGWETASQATAHDFIHDRIVEGYCYLIAPNAAFGGYAAAAALCHSTDRRYPTENDTELANRIRDYLSRGTSLSPIEKAEVIDIVLHHHMPNHPVDNDMLITLKDADRLANLGLLAVIRCGQHYHSLPTFNPRFVKSPDPGASYKRPKAV